MPDVIINFKVQQTGVDEVIDNLTATGQVEAQMAANVKAANASFAEQAKVIGTTAGAADKLGTSLKNIPKSIVGGAAKEVEDLRAKFQAGGLSVNVFATAVSLAAKKLQELTPGSKAFTSLQNEIKATVVANELMNKSFTSTRSELRAMREALVQLEDAGLEGTRTFNEIAMAAGRLDDQIGDTQARIKALGSDTLALDAGIQAVQGVAGAFSVLQGVTALAGAENEELQKTLLKVNGAMAILTGLQQVQQVIAKQTILTTVTENALKRIGAAATALQSATESQYIVVRVAATAAQRGLNAAMAANTATVLLVAIAAVASALLYFTSRTTEAEKAQTALAESIKRTSESATFQAELLNVLASGYQNEVDLLRASGAERSVIADAEAKSIRKQIADQQNLQKELRLRSGGEEEFSASLAKESTLRGQLRVKEAEMGTAILEEGKEASKKALEENQKNLQKFLRDQVAANEAALIEARTASEKLTATINLAQSRARLEISQPDTGPNQRLLAELKAGEDIRKARQDLFGDLEKIGLGEATEVSFAENKEILANAEVNRQILEGKQARAQEETAIIEERIEREKQLNEQFVQASFDTALSLLQSLSEISRNQSLAEEKRLRDRLNNGLISQREYDRELRRMKRKQAEDDKKLAIFQAIVATARAVTQALPVIPLAILAGLLGAVQIALIAAQPIPAFAKGTKNAPGGPSLVGEAGAELIYQNGKWDLARRAQIMDLQRGAKVLPAWETSRILNEFNIPAPGLPAGTEQAQGVRIDYNKLGEAIGMQISKLPLQVNNWDERGYNRYNSSMSKRSMYLSKKYKL